MTADPASLPRKRTLRRRARHALQRNQRRVKKALRRALMAVGLYTIPYLYVAYMWLVYRTSRVEELGPNLDIARREFGRGVYALWHDEVFFVAWAFGKYRPDTLASQGDSGSIIAKMLEVCGYRVFRGGSSSGEERRSAAIVRDMIARMKSESGVIYGITTDGSKGPIYRMKKGAVHIAARTGAPVFVLKTWCRRYFSLPTWDRTLVPLPFNHIVTVYKGPIAPRADLPRGERADALLRDTERELCRVTAYARARAEGLPLPPEWLDLFPSEVRAEMARAEDPAPLFTPTGADAIGR